MNPLSTGQLCREAFSSGFYMLDCPENSSGLICTRGHSGAEPLSPRECCWAPGERRGGCSCSPKVQPLSSTEGLQTLRRSEQVGEEGQHLRRGLLQFLRTEYRSFLGGQTVNGRAVTPAGSCCIISGLVQVWEDHSKGQKSKEVC